MVHKYRYGTFSHAEALLSCYSPLLDLGLGLVFTDLGLILEGLGDLWHIGCVSFSLVHWVFPFSLLYVQCHVISIVAVVVVVVAFISAAVSLYIWCGCCRCCYLCCCMMPLAISNYTV